MAYKKKNHYYVLVFSMKGAVYVTGIAGLHTAEWDCSKPPQEFEKYYAQEIEVGLLCNGYNACVVNSREEITGQPYHYDMGHFEWKWGKRGEEQ